MRSKLPPSGAGKFATRYPDAWKAYQELGKAASQAGPLGEMSRRLLKLALSIGARSEGAVHSHTRQALEEGIPPEEIRQVCVMAITTLGFPAAMAALSWVDDVIDAGSSG